MAKKEKLIVFDVFSGQFLDDLPEDLNFDEYMQAMEAERAIAVRMIKQRLDKINPEDYEESTD